MFNVIQERKLTLSEMFSLAGDVLQKKGALIVGITTFIFLIVETLALINTYYIPEYSIWLRLFVRFMESIVGTLVPLAIIAITYQVIQEREEGLKAISAIMLKYWLPGLWVNIMTGIIVMIAALFLVIPGIIVGISYAFAIHAMVIRNQRGYAALEYSWDVVKGNRGKVCAVYLLYLVTIFGIIFVLGLVFSLDPASAFVLEVGVSVIASLFTIVEVVMFLNFEAFKKSVVPPDESDDHPVLI